MNEYLVKSKDYKINVIAETRDDAFALFFKSIIDDKVSLLKLGHLAMIEEDGEEYGLRTAPILVILGYLDRDLAIDGISNLLGISILDAEEVLKQCIKDDRRIADKILSL
jgi:hypothetical protein